MNNPAVNHSVQMRTQTDGQPTSMSSSDSVLDVVHPVSSIPEYILASANMRWKNEYTYVTGLGSVLLLSSSELPSSKRGCFAPARGEDAGDRNVVEDPALTAEYTTDKIVVSIPNIRVLVDTATV